MDNREKQISAVTIWGAVVNLLLALVKMAAGIFGRSSAMVADAVHSFSDLISDFVVLVMVRIAGKDKDKGHDFGHGKFETLATLVVSLLLLWVAGNMMAEGIGKIKSVLSGGELPKPGMLALWAALVSIAVKEVLYQWTARVGKKMHSPALIANAWHHRSDALSSVGSLIGIAGAIILGGRWTVLDPIAACIISIVIIVVAVKMSLPALGELTDASLSDEVEDEICRIVKSVPGVDNVHELRTRTNGPRTIIWLHIVVDPEMTVQRAHEITIGVENALKEKFGAETIISVHVEPHEDAD